MRADEIAYREWLHTLSREALEEECLGRKQDADHNRILFEESQKSLTAASKDYKKTSDELKTLRDECRRLNDTIRHTEAEQILGRRERFGSRDESLEDLLVSSPDDLKDPTDEDAGGEQSGKSSGPSHGARSFVRRFVRNSTAESGAKKKKVSRSDTLRNLQRVVEYDIDPEALNEEYGESGWKIAFWHEHCKVETRRSVRYVRVIKTAVLSVEHGDRMVTLQFLYPMFERSILTPSLTASFLYNKFFLHLPFYRQEEDMRQADGFAVPRQTMIRWAVRLACRFLWRVYEHMRHLEADCPYQNADETFLRVVGEKGSRPGRKYYVWVFSTGELTEGHPITVYRYGPSRSAESLREHLGVRDYLRIITCDAYAAYSTAAKESGGKISVSNCLSHARRRWVYALEIIHPDQYTDGQLMELPEVRALLLIQEVFLKDTPLRKLSAQERQEKRNAEVRPAMEAYLDFVHSLNPEALSLSEKARDAISYTVNHEAGLTKFLDDGNIPPDNSYAERNVKNIALGRRSWLFAMTPDGARTICVYDTFVGTARANHANVYYYLKYLIEKAPLIPQTGGEDLLDELMPWSETYRKYEKEQASQDASLVIGGEDPPRPGLRERETDSGAPDNTENSAIHPLQTGSSRSAWRADGFIYLIYMTK